MAKMADIEKTAIEVFFLMVGEIDISSWQSLPNSTKHFYRKIARWHLKKLEEATKNERSD